MHSHTFKIVLLLAVSVNQFAGGLSCCCLPRLLASTLSSAVQPTETFVTPPESASKTTCPKCCQPRIESKSTASVVRNSPPKAKTTTVSGDGRCNCAHPVSIGIFEEKSFGERELAQQQPAIPYLFWEYDSLTRLANAKKSYSPPLRHLPNGRSWQSLACIWIA